MKKLIKITSFLLILVSILTIKVEAASFGLSSNKTSVTVGESFNVTISGVYGKVSISGNNVGLSTSGTQWIEGTLNITATTKSQGKATVTVTAIDAATTGANPEEITGSKSVSVEVKEKVAEPPITTESPAKPSNKTNNNTNKTNNKKETNQNKNNNTTITQTQEKEEASSEWGIHKLKIIGIKEDNTQVDLTINPEFSIKQYDYTCDVPNDIVKVIFEKEAYEYTDFIKANGNEELKEGENTFTFELEKNEKEKLIYTIVINKKSNEEIENTQIEQFKPAQEEYYIKLKPIWFALIEIVTVFFTVIITLFILKIQLNKRRKH